jgi:hypothetical protein
MSQGIIETATRNRNMFLSLEARELSQGQFEGQSEQSTLADLVVPGTGHSFSDEFACLLSMLSASGEAL